MLTKAHVAAFVDGPVARKTLTQIGVQIFLVAVGAAAPKRNRVKDGSRCLTHEIKAIAAHALMHGREGGLVVCWLARNITKSLGREVSAKHQKFTVIITPEAWVGKNFTLHILKHRCSGGGPTGANGLGVIIEHDIA